MRVRCTAVTWPGRAGLTGTASATASAAAVANPVTAAVGAAAVAGYGLDRLGKWAFGSKKSTSCKQRIEGAQHVLRSRQADRRDAAAVHCAAAARRGRSRVRRRRRWWVRRQ